MKRKEIDPRIDLASEDAPREWFVYLKPGHHLDGAHCFGAGAQIKATMRRVRPCSCHDCMKEEPK